MINKWWILFKKKKYFKFFLYDFDEIGFKWKVATRSSKKSDFGLSENPTQLRSPDLKSDTLKSSKSGFNMSIKWSNFEIWWFVISLRKKCPNFIKIMWFVWKIYAKVRRNLSDFHLQKLHFFRTNIIINNFGTNTHTKCAYIQSN